MATATATGGGADAVVPTTTAGTRWAVRVCACALSSREFHTRRIRGAATCPPHRGFSSLGITWWDSGGTAAW